MDHGWILLLPADCSASNCCSIQLQVGPSSPSVSVSVRPEDVCSSSADRALTVVSSMEAWSPVCSAMCGNSARSQPGLFVRKRAARAWTNAPIDMSSSRPLRWCRVVSCAPPMHTPWQSDELQARSRRRHWQQGLQEPKIPFRFRGCLVGKFFGETLL
jgi:hypothetical protein